MPADLPSNSPSMPAGPIAGAAAWVGPQLARRDDWNLRMACEAGDMQFLHNHQILHSRNDFENWPDPARHRHLLRLWIAPASGRALPAVFAPRYGAVTPGERGGIIVPGARLSVSLTPE